MLENLLFEQGNFLQLTRENPHAIPKSINKTLDNGCKITLLDTGVVDFNPQINNGDALVISCGVHGNETAPIEMVDRLFRSILTGEIPIKSRLLLIIGNPVSMNLGKRFETENMNRLFCGKHQGKSHYEAKRAAVLEGYLKDFFSSSQLGHRYHYDLHTAIRASKYKKFAIYPFTDGREWDKKQLQFFLASDINTILLAHQPAGTFSYFSSHQFDAMAFTVELGKVRPFGENDRQEYQKITQNLVKLISGEKVPLIPFENNHFNLFKVKQELIKQTDDGFKLNIAEDVENFSDFPQDFKLTEDSQGGYTTQQEGEAIVFPNAQVPVGQRVGLIVVKTQL